MAVSHFTFMSLQLNRTAVAQPHARVTARVPFWISVQGAARLA